MPRWTFYAVFITVATAVVLASHRYLWLRAVRDTGLPPPWRWAATALVLLLAACIPAVFPLTRALSPELARKVLLFPNLWMGVLLYLVMIFLGADLVRGVVWLAGKLPWSGSYDSLADPARRLFLLRAVAGAALGGSAVLALAGARAALLRVVVRRVEVRLARLPAGLDGMTIVQLTDLHLGPTLGRSWLEGVLRQVEALSPDLVAITGDLVDGSVDQLARDVAPLAGIRAPMGTFFVTGNHEYYSGADHWVAKLRSLGVTVLRNERTEVGKGRDLLYLAGVDDFNAGRHLAHHGPDLPRALAGRDPSREVVLLAHQPRAVLEAARHDVGLVLSGHTHGGQLWPWTYMVYLQQPYIAGLHRHAPQTQVYVSQGTGFWGPPMRVGTRCEITHITLRRG